VNKEYCNGFALHEKLLKGVDTLTENVAATLGPKGRNVIIHRKNANPFITKDGVTIAKFVDLSDPFENAAAQIIKEAALNTNMIAGDGTTTSIVLTQKLISEAQKYLRSGISPVELKRGMDVAVEEVIQYLTTSAKQVSSKEDIASVATISANGDKVIGELIAMAIDQAGKNGSVSIEEARSAETSLELIEGFAFDSGYVSPSFITDERTGAVKHENCLFFITDHKLEALDEVLPVLELAARESRPFIIIADDIKGQFLAALVANSLRGSMKVAAVKAPFYGEQRQEILSDLALSTGATFIKRESGISFKEIKLSHFGRAKNIEIYKNKTIIAGGKADYKRVEEKIETIKEQIKSEESMQICERLQERITRLVSGVAVIKVGAASQIELVEKVHRIEDALGAVRAAQLGGIHAGGGVGLVRASKKIKVPKKLPEEQKIGFKIVLTAIKEPIKQMARNAGESPDIILSLVEKSAGPVGYDFVSRKIINLVKHGIIDPVRVTCCALRNAASVASTLITTTCAIVEEE